MIKGWFELLHFTRRNKNHEFVSADARSEIRKDTRSYEMLSKEISVEVTPLSPVTKSPMPGGRHTPGGRQTPDYFGHSARYHAPSRSYSSPRPPSAPSWDPQQTFAHPQQAYAHSQQTHVHPQQTYAHPQKTYHPTNPEDMDMNPLGMHKLYE